MNRMMRITIWILMAALLLTGTSIANANAAATHERCAPAGTNIEWSYWSYYQYPAMAACGTAIIHQPRLYWSYYQFPPTYNFSLAQQP